MIFRTLSVVSGVTRLEQLMTRETVALDTPAIFAISRMLTDMISPYVTLTAKRWKEHIPPPVGSRKRSIMKRRRSGARNKSSMTAAQDVNVTVFTKSIHSEAII